MLNPEPSPPPPPVMTPQPVMTPPATPLNGETMSHKKNRRTRVSLPLSLEVVDLDVDESASSLFFTPISFIGSTKSNAISVVEQHDAVSNPVYVIDLSDTEDDDDVRILNFTPANTSFGKRKKFKGESSNSVPFVCEICIETKTSNDAFSINGCCHVYCNNCVALYVESKLEDNVVNISCPVPRCRGLLEAEDCRLILTPEILDRWGKALCEAVISVDEKFYCPFPDCSTLLIREGKDEGIRESECPNCRRLFCALCTVPWHVDMTCEEFQKLSADERGKEDVMLMNLAKEMMWKRCPSCGFYVAKTQGCMYMKCRCGSAFCYNCGAPNLTFSHSCNSCRH
ncbi:unnamed protein product [Sphenostylis stenocarpa]|uniref:RBR-type E3 ubiquitin transferase n=1 Tax=Sphenostylis stenocarpa TaxID=92480 RepID=A0AA86VU91_9FABA|nr:unnamed protein product [Sphenostylis stenocarpa]